MSIIFLNVTDYTGQAGMIPRRNKMVTTANLATITTAGYLNDSNLLGASIRPIDIFDVVYSYNPITGTGTSDVFVPTISNGVITLHQEVFGGNVLLPVTSGDIAVFNGTTGQITSFPVLANTVLSGSFALPDINANIFNFAASASAVQLASGGSVTIISSSGTKQYKIFVLYASVVSPVSFSGGGGDRLITITDGVVNYTTVAAATVQAALTNGAWGSTACPFPSPPTGLDTSTQPGTNVVIKYSGGTADYTAGNIHFCGLAVRVV